MSDITRIHERVTMISEVFTPTDTVNKRLREFIDEEYLEEHTKEPDGSDMRFELRSTGFRVVNTGDYYRHQFDISIGLAEAALAACGTAPLHLTGTSGIQEGKNGAARIYLGVREPGRLRPMLDSLDAISPEEHRSLSDRLYVELAQGSLTKNVLQRRQAGAELASMGRHPSARNQLFVATPPKLVTRDIHLHSQNGRVLGQSDAS
jgi:hypothetical protein